MTKEEAYDLCVAAWGAGAAVVVWGETYVVGAWVPVGELKGHGGGVPVSHARKRGKLPALAVEARGTGASWEEALTRAGVLGEVVP